MEQQLISSNESQLETLGNEINFLKKQFDNLRSGLLARHSTLAKRHMETLYELEMLKSKMCEYQNFDKRDPGKIVQPDFT